MIMRTQKAPQQVKHPLKRLNIPSKGYVNIRSGETNAHSLHMDAPTGKYTPQAQGFPPLAG